MEGFEELRGTEQEVNETEGKIIYQSISLLFRL